MCTAFLRANCRIRLLFIKQKKSPLRNHCVCANGRMEYNYSTEISPPCGGFSWAEKGERVVCGRHSRMMNGGGDTQGIIFPRYPCSPMQIRLAHIKKGELPRYLGAHSALVFFLGTATSGLILSGFWRGKIDRLYYVKFACANHFEYSRMI